MADLKTPKQVMAELLALSPEERAQRRATDGVEQVVLAYIDKAIEDSDPGMLKYIIDFADKATAKDEKDESSPAERLKKFRSEGKEALLGK